MEAVTLPSPAKVPASAFLRIRQIIGQKGVSVEQALENKRRAAEITPELQELERIRRENRNLFDRDPTKVARFRELRRIFYRPRRPRPEIPKLVPVSDATWWAGVKSGRYPKGIKLGPGTIVWREADILSLLRDGPGKAAA